VSHEVKRAFIFCSDPRVKLWKNVKQKLVLPEERVITLSWFGGPIALANPKTLPEDFYFAMNQIAFCIRKFPSVETFVPIGHMCGYYENISPEPMDAESIREDLMIAAVCIMQKFSGKKAISYYARDMGEHGREFDFEMMGEPATV
jgi:hypothetical protein